MVEAITRGQQTEMESQLCWWGQEQQVWFGKMGLGRKKRPEVLRDCGGGQTQKSGFPTLSLTSLQRSCSSGPTQVGELFLSAP